MVAVSIFCILSLVSRMPMLTCHKKRGRGTLRCASLGTGFKGGGYGVAEYFAGCQGDDRNFYKQQ